MKQFKGRVYSNRIQLDKGELSFILRNHIECNTNKPINGKMSLVYFLSPRTYHNNTTGVTVEETNHLLFKTKLRQLNIGLKLMGYL